MTESLRPPDGGSDINYLVAKASIVNVPASVNMRSRRIALHTANQLVS